MRVLLIEDDPHMSAMIRHGLSSSGFSVEWAPDGRTGFRKASSNPYCVIVLDLMLPEMDGWEVCRQLRAARRVTPILMITARDLVPDRVAGLEAGADDYLPKPFDFSEFLARIRALIRRDRVFKSRHLHVRDLEIDTANRTVLRDGRAIPLTRLEYDIFEVLATQVGRTVSRETLLELVWQDREPGSNKLDVAIRSIRRKVDTDADESLIQTVYGFGYTIPPAAEPIL